MTTTTLTRTAQRTEHDAAAGHGRITSIDVLRGVTILVMIFVNDVAGVAGTPAWMKHLDPPGADGMTFVDVVFPAFLFIVGLSIPLALERRFERGEPLLGIVRHVVVRWLSLLVIGVYMVNTEVISAEGLLPPSLWTLLMYAGVTLVWLSPPRRMNVSPGARTAMRTGGAVLLAVLAVAYTSEEASGVVAMRPYWWGILGIIGWAYLVASAAYLVFRTRTTALLGCVAVLYAVYAADAVGYFAQAAWITAWVDAGSVSSHAAITLLGVIPGVMLLPGSRLASHADRMRWTVLYGLALAVVAHLLHAAADVHQMFTINKIYATPPWGLWCGAITAWIWAGIYWVLDVRGATQATGVLEHAGQNALLAYVMAPIFYAAFAFAAHTPAVPDVYGGLGASFAAGLLRSVVFTAAVVWLAALLRRRGFVLKL